jgi:hypothetical protein
MAHPVEHLHLVDDAAANAHYAEFLTSLHPALAGAAVFITSHEVAFGTVYRAQFAAGLSGMDVIDVLRTPMEDVLEEVEDEGVRRGIQLQRYPNSALMENARRNKNTREHAQLISPDMSGLTTVINKEMSQDEVLAEVYLYGDDLLDIVLHEELATMKPARLLQLCELVGIPASQLELTRLHRSRGGFFRDKDLARLGISADVIRGKLQELVFSHKKIESSGENAYIEREELPLGDWVDDLRYIRLIKHLQDSDKMRHVYKDQAALQEAQGKRAAHPNARAARQVLDVNARDLAERWRIGMRQSNRPQHMVDPVVQWFAPNSAARGSAELAGGGDMTRLYRHFVFGKAEPYYVPATHRVVHPSPVVGNAIAAHSLARDESMPHTIRSVINRLFDYNPYTPWRDQELPSSAAGTYSLALGAISMADVFRQEAPQFKRLETQATPAE